jgi:hypothetical protein
MLVTIVRASIPHTTTLLKSFTNANGVSTIFEAILDFEHYFDTHFETMSETLKHASEIVFIGERPIEPNVEYAKFYMSGKSNGKRLRNIEAYQYLANTFLKAKNVSILVLLVTTVAIAPRTSY